MKLKQINQGYKCPNCKKFGLRTINEETQLDYTIKRTYECKNCFAIYKEE